MDTDQITNIIQRHKSAIAETAYPELPLGNTELKFTVGSEDGEYTKMMNAMGLSFARSYFINAIMANVPLAMSHAALILAGEEFLRKNICNRDADFYYESDGHYETGNTRDKNRAKFWNMFPAYNELRTYAHQMGAL